MSYYGYGPPYLGAPAVPRLAPPGRPLRIIHVGPCLLPGGAEQWLIDLVRFLDPQRLQVVRTIVTNTDMVDPHFLADVPMPVEIGQRDAVRRAAQECDVLLSWGIELDEWLAGCRPPLCLFLAHGEGDWTRQLLANSRLVIDHVIAVSRAVQERMGADIPTTVIWNGVDCARLATTRSRGEMRASLGFAPGDFVLGYVGRFSPEKRPWVILEAVAELPRMFKALMVGWGALRGELMEAANARLPGRYAFVSTRKYLGDHYQAMDAVCLVSDQEGFPLVLLEAMMCGRPLVLTPVGCVPEIIEDRINGVVVPGDPASVAAAARRLRCHPHWARALGREGQVFAARHGHARRMAGDYEQLLHRLWREKFRRPVGSGAPG